MHGVSKTDPTVSWLLCYTDCVQPQQISDNYEALETIGSVLETSLKKTALKLPDSGQ